ncbi:MAG TPA: hypothetical protein DEA71_10800 [Nitrospira sp.]|nr:hypothetical protein [Nitrospira sp.]
MVIPPKYAVSRVVEILKSITSRQLKEKFTHVLSKVYWDGGGGWARGFFPSTVGINEATIRHYVQHQGEQETGQAQLDLQLFEGLPVHLAVRMVLEIAAPLAMILGTQKFRHVAEYTGNPPMHTAYCQFTPKSHLIERHERWPLSPRESPTHRS